MESTELESSNERFESPFKKQFLLPGKATPPEIVRLELGSQEGRKLDSIDQHSDSSEYTNSKSNV